MRGLGIDAVEIERVRAVWERHGERFLRRVFTEAERRLSEESPDPAATLAGRFAAKAALMKALGVGPGSGIGWRDVEVRSVARGIPKVELRGPAAERAERLGSATPMVSITHTRDLAIAQALLG